MILFSAMEGEYTSQALVRGQKTNRKQHIMGNRVIMKVKALAVLGCGLALCFSQAGQAAKLQNQNDKVSYTIGYDMGSNFKTQQIDINAQALAQGIKDAQTGAKAALTKKQMQQTLVTFQQALLKKRVKQLKSLSEKNKKAGAAFLAANKKKPGVKSLSSGLQYKVIDTGKGISPTANDAVTVEYEGKFINGKVFDSSYKTGKPVNFRVTEVIPGWTQALQMMKPGATWMIYVPPKLAYGDRGMVGPIGPNKTLIFKIHLVSVKKGDKSANSAAQKKS